MAPKIKNPIKKFYWDIYKYFYNRPQISRHVFRPIHRLNEIRLLRRIFNEYRIDCVFDVGANIGQYATMIRKDVGFKGIIISFEPNPDACTALSRKADRDSRWFVENVALSDTVGDVAFNVMHASQFSSLQSPLLTETDRFAAPNTVERTIQVKSDTLAAVLPGLQGTIGFARPFLKMDTQGHDAAVIRGAGACCGTFLGLQSELSVMRIYENSLDYRESIALYESLGFRLCALLANNRGHFPMLIEMDCIMLRADLMKHGA